MRRVHVVYDVISSLIWSLSIWMTLPPRFSSVVYFARIPRSFQ